MLKVRLQRVGRKNDPSFRVVVTDSKNGPKSGRFIEVLGAYDARRSEPQLKSDRIKYWLSVGAQTSGTVHNLLISQGVIKGDKVNVLPKRRPIKKAEDEASANTAVSTETSADSAPAKVIAEDSVAKEPAVALAEEESAEKEVVPTPAEKAEKTEDKKEETKLEADKLIDKKDAGQ
ncbi:MAG: 30S ribosomal protein S16 [Candidatus Paceibacterota bacterium]